MSVVEGGGEEGHFEEEFHGEGVASGVVELGLDCDGEEGN